MNSLRYKDLIQDLVLVGADPAKFDAKYASCSTEPRRGRAARRAAWRSARALLETKSLAAIELVLGREEAVVGRVQDLTLQVGNDFVQRYYSNVLGAGRERRAPLRRGPERAARRRR